MQCCFFRSSTSRLERHAVMAEQGPLSNQKLGEKYLLGELLGQGGFGVVYKAEHILLHRPQAIKILLEQYLNSLKFRERFTREAQTLAALDHPNIVHVDDFGIEGSRAYLVMPLSAAARCMGCCGRARVRWGWMRLGATWSKSARRSITRTRATLPIWTSNLPIC